MLASFSAPTAAGTAARAGRGPPRALLGGGTPAGGRLARSGPGCGRRLAGGRGTAAGAGRGCGLGCLLLLLRGAGASVAVHAVCSPSHRVRGPTLGGASSAGCRRLLLRSAHGLGCGAGARHGRLLGRADAGRGAVARAGRGQLARRACAVAGVAVGAVARVVVGPGRRHEIGKQERIPEVERVMVVGVVVPAALVPPDTAVVHRGDSHVAVLLLLDADDGDLGLGAGLGVRVEVQLDCVRRRALLADGHVVHHAVLVEVDVVDPGVRVVDGRLEGLEVGVLALGDQAVDLPEVEIVGVDGRQRGRLDVQLSRRRLAVAAAEAAGGEREGKANGQGTECAGNH